MPPVVGTIFPANCLAASTKKYTIGHTSVIEQLAKAEALLYQKTFAVISRQCIALEVRYTSALI
jgi:hypothetical protein